MGGVKCSDCKKTVNRYDDYLVCTKSCRSWFHIACIGVTLPQLTDMKKSGVVKVWECGKCPSPGDQSDNSDPPVTATPPISPFDFTGLSRPAAVSENSAANTTCVNCSKLADHFSGMFEQLQRKMSEEMASFRSQMIEEIKAVLVKGLDDGFGMLAQHQSGIQSSSAQTSAGTGNDVVSYARAVVAEPSVVIKPKDKNQSAAATKADLLREVNPVTSGVSISRVRNIKDGGLIIGCTAGDSTAKLRREVADKLSQKYTIREVAAINPRVRIVGMTDEHDSESLRRLLKAQNPSLFDSDCDLKIVSFSAVREKKSNEDSDNVSTSKRKRRRIYQSVIQLKVDSYKRVMSSGQVFIGYDCCSVFDAVEITRCFKCSGFHHTAGNCKSKVACPRCAEDHLLADCKSESLKCINCLRIKTDMPNTDVNHAAWERNCAVYQQKLRSFKTGVLNLE